MEGACEHIVTELLRALLGNGSVTYLNRETVSYEVRAATVATQRRGKHISAAVNRHAIIGAT
jgi:hypothetical protein